MFKFVVGLLLAVLVAGVKDMMKEDKDMKEGKDTKMMAPSCTPIDGPLLDLHPFFYSLLKETGLLDEVLNGFRGTIIVPEDESIMAAADALDLDLEDEGDMMILKKVLMYHLIPDVTVFAGAVDDLSLRLSTKLSAEDATTLCVDTLGLEEYRNTVRYSAGARFVRSPGAKAGMLAEVEFCGPLVKIVVDDVLLPCDILGRFSKRA